MFEISREKADELKAFIDSHNFFFITGHKEPDGDCITSCLGIAAILDYFGKPYQLLSAGPFKRNEVIRWQDKFSATMEFQDETERKTSGLFIADCSELIRLGDIDGDLKGFDTFVIDHHKTSEIGGELKGLINPDAPACAFLVQLFYEALIGPVPSELAKTLFFGICTDTGFFRFLTDNSAEVFAAVSRLVGDGADPRTTYREINSGKP